MPGLLGKMLPQQRSFFDLFIDIAEVGHQASGALFELLTHFEDVPAKVARIKALEHKADDIAHSLFTRLNQSFITPFDREDIHDLSTVIDDVVDLIDAASSRLLIYRVDVIRPGVPELARTVHEATGQLLTAMKVFEKHDHVLNYCIEINRLENECDRLSRTLIAQLFDEEKDPVQIIKWKEIIEVIETAADKCEDVANVIESVTLKNS